MIIEDAGWAPGSVARLTELTEKYLGDDRRTPGAKRADDVAVTLKKSNLETPRE